MTGRTKRTYNLSVETVAHVRELAGRYDTAASQDGVVELAIERLYREVQAREEAARWSDAAEDDAFRAELQEVSDALEPVDRSPRG